MLALITQAGPVGIIIKANMLRPPEQEHGEPRVKNNADGSAQALRPLCRAAKYIIFPGVVANERAHFAATAQEGIFCIGSGHKDSLMIVVRGRVTV